MAKTNAYLAKRDAEQEIKYLMKLHIMQQMGLDAAMIAAHEVFQLGKGRALQFGTKYIEAINDIATLIVEDKKVDKEIVYARADLDRKIKRIVGEENFAPWEERYSIDNRKGKK